MVRFIPALPGALSLVLAAAAAFPVLAQEVKPDPCDRTGGAVIAGVDLDVVRCQISLNGKQLGEDQVRINQLRAQIELAMRDVRRYASDSEARAATLIDWLKKAQAETAAAEAQKATLVEWLKAAQEAEVKVIDTSKQGAVTLPHPSQQGDPPPRIRQ